MTKAVNFPLEILYIVRSSVDNKGKRVLLRMNGTENWFYPGEGLTDIDIALWRLSQQQQQEISEFLGGLS